MKKFYGKYLTEAEARKAMSYLYQQGYMREDIKIIGNHISAGNEDNEENESMWDKVKETFNPTDDHDHSYEKHLSKDEKMEISGHETHLQAGEVVLLVDDRLGEPKEVKFYDDKEKVQTDEINVKKVTKKETETIEVPIEKEELIIEKKSAGGDKIKEKEIKSNRINENDEIERDSKFNKNKKDKEF